jgi:hypothetical protein
MFSNERLCKGRLDASKLAGLAVLSTQWLVVYGAENGNSEQILMKKTAFKWSFWADSVFFDPLGYHVVLDICL